MAADSSASDTEDVVEALGKLHPLRFSNAGVQGSLSWEFYSKGEEDYREFNKAVFGEPWTGFLAGGTCLLPQLEWQDQFPEPHHSVQPLGNSEDCIIASNLGDSARPPSQVSTRCSGPRKLFLCHNDLTPRNLILGARQGPEGNMTYRLAAVIGWELGGFYPPVLKLGLHITSLGKQQPTSLFLPASQVGNAGDHPPFPITDRSLTSLDSHVRVSPTGSARG